MESKVLLSKKEFIVSYFDIGFSFTTVRFDSSDSGITSVL